ncbi:MAG: hypothetical protein QOD64_684 [Verrucomicrobiota bacterium]
METQPPVPAPSPSKSSLLLWLSNANNVVTTIGAIVAAVAAILTQVNKREIEQVNGQIKRLEAREKTEQASEKYAALFMDKVLNDKELIKSEKRTQALLAIMNLVAQASSSQTGESDAKARAIMPFHLALLLGLPGGVAAMDTNYEHLDDWVAIASSDNSPQTRVTAIQALGGVCQKALIDGRLDVLLKGVRAVDSLLNLVPEEQIALRGSATAARAQLAFFIKKEQKLLAAATCRAPKGGDDAAVRLEIAQAFPDAATTTQQTQEKLTAFAKLEESGQANVEKLKEVKQSLNEVYAALQTASTVTISEAMTTPGPSTPGATAGATPASTKTADPLAAKINDLIKNLTDADQSKVSKARSELALFGQKAVKPLLEIARQSYGKKLVQDVELEGMSEAFRKMRQPIQLDTVDAYWVASVLRSPNSKARDDMAEFLMNLENSESVRICFDALEQVFYDVVWGSETNVETAATVAAVVGTWARNIGRENHSREAGKSFPTFAFETAKQWKGLLESSPKKQQFRNAVGVLTTLIARANKGSSLSQGAGTRNLELDPKRNLAATVKALEKQASP